MRKTRSLEFLPYCILDYNVCCLKVKVKEEQTPLLCMVMGWTPTPLANAAMNLFLLNMISALSFKPHNQLAIQKTSNANHKFRK